MTNRAVLGSEARDSCRAPRRSAAARPWFGMKSRSHAGSGSRRLIVGGRKPRSMRERRRHDAGRAARALWMADHRFHRRSRHLLGALAEHFAHAPRFDGVVDERRRAVVVDVADLLAAAAPTDRSRSRSRGRSRRRRAPSARGGTRRRSNRSLRRPRRSSRRARARDLRARAPASRRPRRARTRRAPCRTGATLQPGRSLYAIDTTFMRENPKIMPGRHARIGAARQDHVRLARSHERRRVADGVGRARAAAREDVADAVQPQRDRNLARHHADDRDGDGVRRDALPALDEEVVVLALADVDASAAAADDDARVRLADATARRRPRLRARR